MPDLLIRPANPSDIASIVALQRVCFPYPFPEELLWKPEHIESHLQRFREGQFVAISDSRVVGSCTNMLVSHETWNTHLDWESVTGGLALPRHNPNGSVIYGIDIGVHPDLRGQGIARKLYQARFDLAKASDWQYGTVCRIPGFSQSEDLTTESYANRVVTGELVDQTLTPLLKIGLTHVGIISGYMEDPESGNAGAILKWIP